MKDVSWASIAEPVARELLGEPNRTYSGKRELRWGRKGSLVVHVDRGTWHDFEAGEGGGVLDLIQRETNTDKAGAIAWLQERGYLSDPSSPYTAHRSRSRPRKPPEGHFQPKFAVTGADRYPGGRVQARYGTAGGSL